MQSEEIIWASQASSLRKLQNLICRSQAERIFLVLPAGGKLSESLTGVKILNLLAKFYKKKITFISSKSRFREILRKEGLAYLARLPIAEAEKPQTPKVEERISQPPPLKPKRPAFKRIRRHLASSFKQAGLILGIFFLGLIILGAVFEIGLARAEVLVTLTTEEFSQEFIVLLVDKDSLPITGPNQIKGELVELSSAESQSFDSSGVRNIGSKASGEIILENRSGERVGLKTSTRFLSGELVFYLDKEVIIPPASVSRLGEMVAGQARATVTAAQGGSSSNLSAGKLTIPNLGSLSRLVEARVKAPFSGGVDQEVSVISAEDLTQAQDQLEGTLKERLSQELKGKTPRAKKIYPALIRSSLVEAVPSKKEGEEAEKFDMRVTMRLWTVALKEDDLSALIGELAQVSLKPKERLTPDSLENPKLEVIEEDFLQRKIVAKVGVQGHSTFNLEQAELAESFRRKSFGWVKDTVSRYPDVVSVEIKKKGLLGEKMPWLSRNIIIKEKYQSGP